MLALNQTSLPRVATKRLTRRKTCDTKEAPKLRAREKSLIVVSYRQKGRRPQCYTRAGRARARARAKYPGHFRPAKKRPHQWIFEFFLRDWLELDEILPIIATKTKNSKKICEKKFVSKSPFQGLEPLPQILNKLGRNKKLNPSSRNAKGKAWFLCKIVGTAYFQTRKWPLCYRLIPDTTTPKTSPIEQITDRWEPKNSNLQRVTLQCLTSCYRWSNLLRDNVSNLALASAQNPPKIWKYAWKILIFLLWFLTFWPPFDIVRLHPIG